MVKIRSGWTEKNKLKLFVAHTSFSIQDKSNMDVLTFDNTLIFEKIKSGFLISEVAKENLVSNCTLLNDGDFGDSDDDISRFTLVEIEDEAYRKFKNHLFEKLQEICKMK